MAERNLRKTRVGLVTSDKMDKTITVSVVEHVKHPLYGKVIKRTISAKVDVNIYKENRDILYNALTEYGYECVQRDGAFYLFVKALENDAYKFFEKAKSKEILVVPCDDFGVKGYVRIAYCVDKQRIVNSLPAFKEIIEEYNK